MIASSSSLSTSRTTSGGHWDLFRLLHAEQHGTEAFVCSNHPREAAAFTCLAIIFGRIASGYPGSFVQQRC